MNSKIYYIDCYQGENKEGNIGFVKLEDEKIFVMLRGIYAGSGMDCKVYAWDRKGQQTQVMTVSVRNGYGQASSRWPGIWTERNVMVFIYPYMEENVEKVRSGNALVWICPLRSSLNNHRRSL